MNYHLTHSYLPGRSQASDAACSMLEFVVFYPRNEWAMGQMYRTALVLTHRDQQYQVVQVFQDPGPGYQDIQDNHIRPVPRTRLDALGDVIYQLPIPLSASTEYRTIFDLLQRLEKVDTRINPGGLFPWTFGNFVRRALQKLARNGHIIESSLHPAVPASEFLYDMFLSRYLGKGHM
ncbi:hypothetical protein D9613_007504 [Agrocybe pediades]|uniref:Uncharacterized protein n=1 Tax=Agrocybe pediades TaxID=84607 RepID=A0A8H4VLE8_9AGAR|nr:hypothetical protein D9613_007504 [Agrocybe pediades]